MSILTDDITKLGRCLVGDFFRVEVTTLNEKDYNLAYSAAYGSNEALMNCQVPLESFEDYMWSGQKDVESLISEIECMKMPDEPESVLKDYIGYEVLNILRQKFTDGVRIGYGRQIKNGVINLAATYQINNNSVLTIQLVRIRLFEK